ncbi:MAG: amidohydrolase [Clostridia bacterium]|nr:amidohydrolase [Clostridia bacterium]
MLFKNITVVDANFDVKNNIYLGTEGKYITYIGGKEPQNAEKFGKVYDGAGKVIIPAFYNAHSHASMNLMRGYAENLSLMNWLFDKIFPFEACLTDNDIYYSTLLSVAEMLRYGIVGTTDMYMKWQALGRAFLDGGVKANFSVGCTCPEDKSFYDIKDYQDTLQMISEFDGAGDGRLIPEFSLHAEYTSTERIATELAAEAKKAGSRIHVHVSETKSEVEECKKRHGGKSPVRYLADCGIFDVPATAAHCVWIDDDDMEILKEKKVSVATCPKSNLKLASGICPTARLIKKGVNVAIGTDSVASNNNLNMIEEMRFFNLLQKGINNDPCLITPKETLYAATRAGALSQGREDTGLLKEGFKADLTVISTEKIYMKPTHDILNNIIYSSDGADVIMTVCDGEVLYENGEYKKLDIEKITAEAEKTRIRILGELEDK